MAPESRTQLRNACRRALGALIMVKAALPLLLLVVLAIGLWRIAAGVNVAVDAAYAAVDPHIRQAQLRVDELRAETRRLLGEVEKIKNTTTEIAGAIKTSVEPIRRSLLGLASAMATLSSTAATGINAIIRVLNGLPFVKDIPYVTLPRIEIPGLALPQLDLDLNLKPDLRALEELNALAQRIAAEAQRAIDEITAVVRFWWWTVKLAAVLILAWIALAIVGYVARACRRFLAGWRMLCGRPVEGGLALL
jgi:hypothetical protein